MVHNVRCEGGHGGAVGSLPIEGWSLDLTERGSHHAVSVIDIDEDRWHFRPWSDPPQVRQESTEIEVFLSLDRLGPTRPPTEGRGPATKRPLHKSYRVG